MKKKIRKRRIPACSMGAKTDLSGMGNALGGALGLFSSIGGKSTATNQQEVVGQSIADVGAGAASGAKIGAMFGPVGGAIGTVGGALVGAIGKKGGIEQTAGFTEDNRYTLGTGFRAFGNKSLKRKQAKDKLNVQGNRIAVANTEELRSEWDEENAQDTYTFADGGTIPTSPAYVDDGELIQTPDGSVGKVPENGNPTDSNLMHLPGGSKILSDKLKVPGTKKTFAQIAEQMMSKRKSNGTDRFAENSKKLNEMNNAFVHDQLFDMQEQLKARKGIKPKTKAFVEGGLTDSQDTPETIQGVQPSVKGGSNFNFQDMSKTIQGVQLGIKPGKTMSTVLPMAGFSYEKNPSKAPIAQRPHTINTPASVKGGSNFNFDNLATDVLSLAPVVSNLFGNKAETVAPVQNPYSNIIQKTMRKRSYDIEPAKQALLQNRAVSDYNANQMNTNTGANMAYRLQSAIAADKATSDLYGQASNIQNQYDADYANTMNSLGQQYVGATNTAQDINMKSRAASRNIRRTGMGQLSEWAQNRQLMSNQQGRDSAMMDVYRPFLEQGYTQDQITEMLKKFKR